MTYKAFLSIIIGSLLIMFCSVCKDVLSTSENIQEYEKKLFAMDTYMTLKAYGNNGQEALEKAAERIQEIESLVSVTNKNSEIYNLNNSNGTDIHTSDDTLFLLNKSLEINNETTGAFNITLYPVSCEWGFTTGKYKVPTKTTIDKLLTYADCNNIIINSDKHTASLKTHTKVDLGGIAKGYAGSEAARIIKEFGVSNAVLNMGGNVQTVGYKPNGKNWKVGIRDPQNGDFLAATIETADKAVITSGGYERYFEDENGNIYWHIIDPKTGFPAKQGIKSVTVIGSDGAFCDALSTSLFVMTLEDSTEFLKNHKDIDAVFILDDNSFYITPGIKDVFIANGNYIESQIKHIY